MKSFDRLSRPIGLIVLALLMSPVGGAIRDSSEPVIRIPADAEFLADGSEVVRTIMRVRGAEDDKRASAEDDSAPEGHEPVPAEAEEPESPEDPEPAPDERVDFKAGDNFRSAIVIASVPFRHDGSLEGYTAELLEMGACQQRREDYKQASHTLWLRWQPAERASMVAETNSQYGFREENTPFMSVYHGTSRESLTEIGCDYLDDPVVFVAEPGTTYYFQIQTVPWDESFPAFWFTLQSSLESG